MARARNYAMCEKSELDMIPAHIWQRINEAPYRGEPDRDQTTLLPECLDDFIDERNPVRAIRCVRHLRGRLC